MYLTKCNFLILIVFIVKIYADGPTSSNSTTSGTPNTITTLSPPPQSTTLNGSLSSPTIITVPSILPTTVPHDTDPTTKTSSKPSTPVSTTPIHNDTSTTPAPIITTADPLTTTTGIPHHNRQFDGPSFIGGIVLATGLMAIGFVAFKFYKARTERNYHTL